MFDRYMYGDDEDQPAGVQKPRRSLKYRSLSELMLRTEKVQVLEEEENDDYSELACEECGSRENEDEMIICDKCDKGYHMNCARPIVVRIPTGNWFCSHCTPRLPPRPRPLTQKKMFNFFGVQKCAEEPMEKLASDLETRKRRGRRSKTLVSHKKKRRLLPYIPAEEASQRLKQMKSLASALMALNLKFSPELSYLPGMAPRSANKAKLEICGMQLLSREDEATLNHIHAMWKRGRFPPLMVVYDSREGYVVVADGPIKDLTLIAEYAGDVDYLEKREEDDCDSLMTLVTAQNPAKTLVICPDKRGNIARFITGINNHIRGSKKKQNTKCLRYDVNGESRVLLVATRDIAKGERLYNDYNEDEYEYPTHHFV